MGKFGHFLADTITFYIGSWTFVLVFNLFIAAWMIFNTVISHPIDPYPFIALNLLLSWLAGIQAPIIMISQSRQEQIMRETLKSLYIISKANQQLLKDQKETIQKLLNEDNSI